MMSSLLGCTFVLWITTISMTGASLPCALRQVGNDKRVCVCNATYCDTIERVTSISHGSYVMFTSTKDGQRLNQTSGKLSEYPSNTTHRCLWRFTCSSVLNFTVNTCSEGQTMFGFGGAFTDAAGINILSLSNATQDNLLRSYFSNDGIEYSLGRVPIGGTDFSPRGYSLNDNNGIPDPQLVNFSLTVEDYDYKIPMIKRAQAMSDNKIKLICAPWSPPVWMKTNNNYTGWGYLKKEYYSVYTKYLLRFLDAYETNGILFWAISTQNEPLDGNLSFVNVNSLGWLPGSLGNWIQNYFGPMIRNSTHQGIKIFTLDDQRLTELLWISSLVNEHPNILDFIYGWAIHWYSDSFVNASVLNDLHEKYPTKHILYTEGCTGLTSLGYHSHVSLGDWGRGEQYISDVIENVNHWSTGWIDWNLCLNENGGPTWGGPDELVDSPVIANAILDEFYKQPMFYALAHVSKFIRPGAVRLFVDQWTNGNVQLMALRNPNNTIVVVAVNKGSDDQIVSMKVGQHGFINVKFEKHSFNTIICSDNKN